MAPISSRAPVTSRAGVDPRADESIPAGLSGGDHRAGGDHPAVQLELLLSDSYVDLAAERIDCAIRITADPPADLEKTIKDGIAVRGALIKASGIQPE